MSQVSGITRRQLILGGSLAAAVRGQTPASFKNEYPDMLVAWFAGRFPATSRQEARTVREKMRRLLAAPAAPLEPRTTMTRQGQGYRIENVTFGGGINATLLLPSSPAGKVPAVVLQRGHFDRERMADDYQQLHFDLVRNGLAVLSFDPIGSGTELSPTIEHFLLASRLALAGESLTAWMLRDAMQAVDYAAGRPEIDATRIGCADYTDTGWTMAMLAAMDERVKCCVLHPHGTAQRWPLQRDSWNQLDDPEQFLPAATREGIDLIDILTTIAPRPMLALVEDQNGDFDNAASQLRKAYAGDNFAVQTARSGEDWPMRFRSETVRWFRRWLAQDARMVVETSAPAEPSSPSPARAVPVTVTTPTAIPTAALVRQVLSISPVPAELTAREFPTARFGGYSFGRVEILSEPGIYLPGGLYRPDRPNGKVVVLTSADVTTFVPDVDDDLAPAAKKIDHDTEETPGEVAHSLAAKGYTVLLIDVRGLGETAPKQVRRTLRGPWEHLRNNDAALGVLAEQLGRPLIGMRVFDVLRAAQYAARFGKVLLAGEGMGALWSLYAAALEPAISGVAMRNGLISYRAVLDAARHAQATSQFPFGVLRSFDLPQVAAIVTPRPAVIGKPVNAMKEVDTVMARAAYGNIAGGVRIVDDDPNMADLVQLL